MVSRRRANRVRQIGQHDGGPPKEIKMADKVRFGLIGSGGQGRYLSDALILGGKADLVACADPNPAAAETAVQQCGYKRAYADTREMLAKEALDAVIVATVHDQLKPCAMLAVQAGKHVMVEKPMALTAADGRELVAAARKAGVRLMVGYTLRFMPERILMKKLLAQGAVGEVVHVTAGQLIGGMGGWLGEKARGGGPLFYIGTHVLDQVLWVVGRKAQRVYAEVTPKGTGGVEADALFTIRFEGGAVAQVCTSQRMGGRYGWLDVIGSGGRMRAEWESNALYVESRTLEAYRNATTIAVPPDAYLPKLAPNARVNIVGFRYVRVWAAELLEFIAAIQESRDPSCSGEDGVRVLEVCDAVFESGRTGKAVQLS
ncbi:MAG: Gfo/Idh/MocA family oxidoreductase [Planctomycetes bacterium]|nr:Gfo/Idh/MocA family oxidoreductase [Planctomycetota bacterium]